MFMRFLSDVWLIHIFHSLLFMSSFIGLQNSSEGSYVLFREERNVHFPPAAISCWVPFTGVMLFYYVTLFIYLHLCRNLIGYNNLLIIPIKRSPGVTNAYECEFNWSTLLISYLRVMYCVRDRALDHKPPTVLTGSTTTSVVDLPEWQMRNLMANL